MRFQTQFNVHTSYLTLDICSLVSFFQKCLRWTVFSQTTYQKGNIFFFFLKISLDQFKKTPIMHLSIIKQRNLLRKEFAENILRTYLADFTYVKVKLEVFISQMSTSLCVQMYNF